MIKLTADEFIHNNQIIQNAIKEMNVSFEGREFPYSMQPLIVKESESNYFKEATEILSDCLEIVLKAYKEDDFVRSYFSHYDKYKSLILSSTPGKQITISRYDVVWYGRESFKVFECNTCCPGGVSILGDIKKNYVQLPFIKKHLKEKLYVPFECDETSSFINALKQRFDEATDYAPKKIGIAFANYEGFYSYELKELCTAAKKMGYNSCVCDVTDLYIGNGDKLYYEEDEINIVYYKVDQLLLNENILSEIITATKNGYVVSVNSYPAMYITESKIVLALLRDSYFQNKYLTDIQIKIIEKHIPWTKKLSDSENVFHEGSYVGLIDFSIKNKDKLVLKIDNETRGANIYIGRNINIEKWENLLRANNNKNWIVQEYCEIPNTVVLENINGEIVETRKKYGIDFFMYNGKYSGIVSRLSESDIINVGSGGMSNQCW
ncbi:glutathionylspermidine synthase family protein [Enterococcus termitis]